MKKSVEILGLPIISITEGRELGISKSLLMDAQNGRVSALIIEDEDWYRGVKLLPYESVIAIGDDAITIISSENILKLNEATEYEPLLDANVRVIDTKAITKSGSIQGKVTEIFIDDDGRIAKCEINAEHPDNAGEVKEITADQVSIFGKQVTIIDSKVPEKGTKLVGTEKKTELGKIETKPAEKVEVAPATEVAAPIVPEPAAESEKKPAETIKHEAEPAKSSADNKAAEERHRRFLLGKKAGRRITTDNGIVIVESGADITEEVLQKAKLANKFVELSMNVQ
ncbi:PRC-barrel domain-containing protein [Propionispira raffinosivorans]|uniref:PRC-barrel domain-containing protein n=1 Tax=Propionispira raffinosivorans TaxID=86959 RepID=UPI000382DD3D|nr:PRC-barrel domain-containing protein [Propionispira raffinosivorans]